MSIAKLALTSGPESPCRFGSDSSHPVVESGHPVRVLTDDRACGECAAVTAAPQFQRMKSAHFWTSFVPGPQGSIGTLDVEFFGEPSTSLSL
jgi:hypothetical protein